MTRLLPAACAAALLMAACGGGTNQNQQTSAPATSATPAPSSVDAATAATVTGKVTFSGTAPAPQPIKLSSDPYCEKANPSLATETAVIASDGAIGNVFVYVKDGLGDRTFPAPSEPVVLDQKGCHYTPHVLGIQVGQPLQIVNSDGTLHNIHALPKKNAEFNIGQPFKGMETIKKFDTVETPIRFKCDVHKWMGAYTGVFNHPFFAVTNDQGVFEIKNLPPGNYVIEAWHEKYGPQTQNVTITGNETKTVDFNFKG